MSKKKLKLRDVKLKYFINSELGIVAIVAAFVITLGVGLVIETVLSLAVQSVLDSSGLSRAAYAHILPHRGVVGHLYFASAINLIGTTLTGVIVGALPYPRNFVKVIRENGKASELSLGVLVGNKARMIWAVAFAVMIVWNWSELVDFLKALEFIATGAV